MLIDNPIKLSRP